MELEQAWLTAEELQLLSFTHWSQMAAEQMAASLISAKK